MHPMLILMIVIGTPGPNGRLSLPARTNILLAVVYNVGVYQGIRTHQIPSFFCMRKRFLIRGKQSSRSGIKCAEKAEMRWIEKWVGTSRCRIFC